MLKAPFQYSTLNLYEAERFMGDEHYYYDYEDATEFKLDNVMRRGKLQIVCIISNLRIPAPPS